MNKELLFLVLVLAEMGLPMSLEEFNTRAWGEACG
jgi:hypothetical protein